MEFNQSVLVDNIVNLVIILPHNERLNKGMTLFVRREVGVFKSVAVF